MQQMQLYITYKDIIIVKIANKGRSDYMPVWYKKYHDLLQRCKRIGRFTAIHSWFEQTDAILRARMQDLEIHKKRTRVSGQLN